MTDPTKEVRVSMWSPEEMADLLEAMARSADRHTLSFSETAHIAREAANLIRSLEEERADLWISRP